MNRKDKMLNKINLKELAPDVLEEMSQWNDENIAFIKHDLFEGKYMWMIYGADGERIAATDDRDFAFIVARQNDLEPLSVH